MSNIVDQSTRNEIRRLAARLAQLESPIAQFVKNSTIITNHSVLQGLDYASSGHTGFASASSIPSAANPTGTVGLTAVNGSAATFLRSDGAPALSAAALAKTVYVGTSGGGDPPNNEAIWIVTDGGPFGSGSIRVSLDGGTTYKETGIVFS